MTDSPRSPLPVPTDQEDTNSLFHPKPVIQFTFPVEPGRPHALQWEEEMLVISTLDCLYFLVGPVSSPLPLPRDAPDLCKRIQTQNRRPPPPTYECPARTHNKAHSKIFAKSGASCPSLDPSFPC